MSARDVIADHAVWCSAHDDKGRYRDADMLLAALLAAGYAVVPMVLPKHMRRAGLAEKKRGHTTPQIWRAMLAAHFVEEEKSAANRALTAVAKEPGHE